MERFGFLMRLKPGCEEEYQRRHDALWPELGEALRAAGISNYSIFLDPETGWLFGVQSRESPERAESLREHPVMRRWWDHMADLMETRPDHEPVVKPLREVFYLE